MGKKKQLNHRLLTDYFQAMTVPVCHNCIGSEYELIGLKKNDLSRLPYQGKKGIKSVLDYLLKRTGSTPVNEKEEIIGLENDTYSITIEPGGQLEASFAVTETIAELEDRLNDYVELLRGLRKRGIVFITSGLDPFNSFSSIPLVPKERYRIMRQYWSEKGGLSLSMMTMTASIHINIDYNSEEDAVNKFNLAGRLREVLGGMFANSCVYKNHLRPTASLRGLIWKKTDRNRTGAESGWDKPITSFQDYADRALDTSMLFIFIDGDYHRAPQNFTFRQFMENGYRGYYPGLKDWILHLNTIFLPIRFNKSILELRFFDCNQPSLLLAMNALVKGIFYSKEDGINNVSPQALIKLAETHLDPTERKYLEPIAELAEEGLRPADLARVEWESNPDRINFCNFLEIR